MEALYLEDKDLHQTLVSLRIHGQGEDKYQNIRIGINGRLDTLQAAILIEKLAIFPEEIAFRQTVAKRYTEGLSDVALTPFVRDDCVSAWAQYTIHLNTHARLNIIAGLKKEGIPTAIYYPLPLHQQRAYRSYPCATDSLPVCEALANSVLSLPMHPYFSPTYKITSSL